MTGEQLRELIWDAIGRECDDNSHEADAVLAAIRAAGLVVGVMEDAMVKFELQNDYICIPDGLALVRVVE